MFGRMARRFVARDRIPIFTLISKATRPLASSLLCVLET
jgi:hypothetical protein